MNNRLLFGLATLVLGTAATTVQAGDRYGQHDRDYGRDHARYAQVLRVEPIVESVRYIVPVQRCRDEQRVYRNAPAPGAVIGGVVGAAIGSQVGRGFDRPATTIGGAIVGALVGNQIARDGRDHGLRQEVVQRCETVQQERWENEVVAYRVNYVYRGRGDVVRLAYDPGRWLRLDDVRHYG